MTSTIANDTLPDHAAGAEAPHAAASNEQAEILPTSPVMSKDANTSTGGEMSGNNHGSGPVRPSQPVSEQTALDIRMSERGQTEAPSGPTRIATWRPVPGKTVLKPEPTPDEKQAGLIAQLKEYTEANLILKQGDKDFESYASWEKRFLQRKDTYPRYMRAADWKLEEAKRRIKYTLEWRREYRPDLIRPDEIAKEAEGGKVVVNGFDRDGRPIVWLRPSRENTKPSPTQIRHLIFQLERAIDLLPEGVEKLHLVVDYKGATSANNPSLQTAKQVIHLLQNHYCERLGRGVVVNVPFFLQAFFGMLKPLMDPKTKEKIRFNPPLQNLIPTQQLDAEFGGQHDYHYDSRVYLPALCHFCGVKEDGTREEVIPKDVPASKPDELQRALTTTHGTDQEVMAESARREAEERERQEQEAREHRDANTTSTEHVSAAAAGGAAVAGATGAAIATQAKADQSSKANGPAAPPATTTSSAAAQPGKKRGGWKLFSSKRGLDKQGNPTPHKHSHIIKAFCMHKGAVDPSKSAPAPATSSSATPAVATAATPAAASTADPTVEKDANKVKIAPEATVGREERIYTNAPLATNATVGPEGYHTAMEGEPEDPEAGDYFTNIRKVPLVKPADVDEKTHPDEAKLVTRPSEIMQKLHEGGTGDLTMAFEVKQPPVEESSTLEAKETAGQQIEATKATASTAA